jgi:hypothetical protein
MAITDNDVPVAVDNGFAPSGELPPAIALDAHQETHDARPSESDPGNHGSMHTAAEPTSTRAFATRRLTTPSTPLFGKGAADPAGPTFAPTGAILVSGKLYAPVSRDSQEAMAGRGYSPLLSDRNQRALTKARVGFEYFFSNYLLKLNFISECGEGGTELTEASQLALEQAVHIVTALREAMSVMLGASMASRDEHTDPFFQTTPLSYWGVVEPDTVVVENEISVAEYVHRLYRLRPGIGLHPVLSELTTMFSIGISREPEHQGKHLLIMPPQMELMNALCNGDLSISWP